MGWLVGLSMTVCGFVLLAGSLYLIPAMGKYLEKLAKFLGGFQGAIGVASVVVAIWDMIDTDIGWENILLLVIGLMLASSVMSALPAVGKYIAKLTKFLGAFQVIIGIIALIAGIIILID